VPKPIESLRVAGGATLDGEVAVLGAKNAALKLMVATLLAPGFHRLDNVPHSLDVEIMGDVLDHVGASLRRAATTLEIVVPDEPLPEAPLDLVRQMRASILILGTLLARTGEARVALPGGDDFGSRPIDLHLKGLEAMGASFDLSHGVLKASAPGGLHGADVYLEFPSVGATENILLASVLADGTTRIGNAAREPELADLADFLRAMGAKIDGAGTSTIEIHGVPALEPAPYRVVPDRLEAGTYAAAAAITGGHVIVRDCIPEHLRMELSKLESAGATVARGSDWISVTGPERPLPVDFATLPFPGFHTDMHPQMISVLSVADGTSIATENVYAARFRYIGELNRMGADIVTDGQHVIVKGVDELSGCEVDGCDIRAAAALSIAGLRAEGATTVVGAHHIDRGYDGFVDKMRRLGADIERI
jgi:UDP-N-acetylglucosamine 1-carboxyvinyltransferase